MSIAQTNSVDQGLGCLLQERYLWGRVLVEVAVSKEPAVDVAGGAAGAVDVGGVVVQPAGTQVTPVSTTFCVGPRFPLHVEPRVLDPGDPCMDSLVCETQATPEVQPCTLNPETPVCWTQVTWAVCMPDPGASKFQTGAQEANSSLDSTLH